jgi:hypothetical protein
MIESGSHFLEMRMLPSAHTFVFSPQKGYFIGLPRLENGKFVDASDVICFDNIHRGFECTRRAQFRPAHMILLLAHDFLLSFLIACEAPRFHSVPYLEAIYRICI